MLGGGHEQTCLLTLIWVRPVFEVKMFNLHAVVGYESVDKADEEQRLPQRQEGICLLTDRVQDRLQLADIQVFT